MTGCPTEPAAAPPGHVHQWRTWTVAATCSDAGGEIRICTLDTAHRENVEIPINPDAHDWGEWEGTVTCDTAGSGRRECRLNAEHAEEHANMPALGHKYRLTYTTRATCTEEGAEIGVCIRDPAHTFTIVIATDPNAHDWSEWEGSVTCDTAGSGRRECRLNAEHIEEEDVMPALGHNYAWATVTAATCDDEGEETGVCTRDAHTVTLPVAALGHDYGWTAVTAATCTSAGEETGVCARDPAHTVTLAVDALGHDEGEWEPITAATCTAAGERELRCTRDSFVLDSETVPIDNTAHVWGNWAGTVTCDTAGLGRRECTLNAEHIEEGAAIPALGHDEGEWDIIPATCTAAGARQLRCTRDSFVLDSETILIDPAAHDYQWVAAAAATETANGEETGTCRHNNAHTNGTRTLWATGTAGLAYELIESGDNSGTYRVHNGGDRSFTTVHIPAYHRPDADSAYVLVTEISNGTDTSADTAFGGRIREDDSIIGNYSLTGVTFAEESRLKSIANYAFFSCNKLTGIDIPAGVTSIGDWTFCICESLSTITIPASVTSIGNDAFSYCRGLTSVTIPEGVTSIGDWTFNRCESLSTITIPASVTSIGNGAFSYCRGLTSVTIPASVTSIGDRAFSYCNRLTGVTIPASVTSIGNYAFSGCSGLTGVTIPASVTSIGNYAFAGCGLTGVTLSAGLTTIGAYMFSGCTGLTGVTIPASVTSIGEYAFQECSSLQLVTCLPATPPAPGYPFLGTHASLAIKVPSASVAAYKAAYGWSILYADRISAM